VLTGTASRPLKPNQVPVNPPAHWEDPYIYQDLRGHWHLLAHVYNVVPFATTGINYISGHGFSEDGLSWNMTAIEPYGYNVSSLVLHKQPAVARDVWARFLTDRLWLQVTYDDGSHASVATRERPKLIFDEKTKEPGKRELTTTLPVLVMHESIFIELRIR